MLEWPLTDDVMEGIALEKCDLWRKWWSLQIVRCHNVKFLWIKFSQIKVGCFVCCKSDSFIHHKCVFEQQAYWSCNNDVQVRGGRMFEKTRQSMENHENVIIVQTLRLTGLSTSCRVYLSEPKAKAGNELHSSFQCILVYCLSHGIGDYDIMNWRKILLM